MQAMYSLVDIKSNFIHKTTSAVALFTRPTRQTVTEIAAVCVVTRYEVTTRLLRYALVHILQAGGASEVWWTDTAESIENVLTDPAILARGGETLVDVLE